MTIDDCSPNLTIEQRTIVEILTTTYVFDKEKVNNAKVQLEIRH